MDKKIAELKEEISKLERELEKDKKGEKRKEGQETKEERRVPLKILYAWKSPSRVFVPRDKVWFLKIATIALLCILFFAFLQDFVVILVICVIVLIAFLLASVPPDKVDHQITTRGIMSIDKMYEWKELRDFWVAKKLGHKILYIRTKLPFPTRLMMLIKGREEIKIIRHLLKYIDFGEYKEKQGWLSKLSEGEMINPDKYLKLFKRKEKAKK